MGANRPRTRFPAYRVVIDKQKPNLTQPMANLCCGKITYLVYENIEITNVITSILIILMIL